jgi:hypothetical protein
VGHSRAQIIALVALASCRGASGDSWTTADWVAAGVPDPGHEWTSDELDLAVKAIEKAVARDRHRLPAFRGTRGGVVFARVTAEPALDPHADPRARFGSIELGLEAHRAFENLYPTDLLAPTSRASIEAIGVMFDDYARLEPAIDPFLESFGSDDPTLQVCHASVQKLQDGLSKLLHGALVLANSHAVPVADRVALLGHVRAAIEAAFPHLDAGAQAQLRSELAILAHGTTGDLHAAAAAVLASLPP